ncbi:hypothetical protein V8E36_000747 [Tilletia maclaganii]
MRLNALISGRIALLALSVFATSAISKNPYEGLASASRIQDLTSTQDFEAALLKAGRGSPLLVVHFHGSCSGCQEMAPIFAGAAERAALAEKADLVLRDVVWARVDGKANAELMRRYGIAGNGQPEAGSLSKPPEGRTIPGYPILTFSKPSAEPAVIPLDEDADSETTINAILKFTRDQLRQSSPAKSSKDILKAVAKESVLALNADTFHAVVLEEAKDVFVKFYAPWCSHCKSLAPRYAKVAALFATHPTCMVTTFNSDPPAERAIAKASKIRGFPTLKFYPATNNKRTNWTKEEPEIYRGPRSPQALVDFLNDRCGTTVRLPTLREEWEAKLRSWKKRIMGGGEPETAPLTDGRGREL